ncbi:MAG TPA: LLM class flavin-dependent oxidoreductase [Streptosporangiaceae bacterium]|nr:LLM class flavin-dependent oxidoreductase [Streptosporangiaceae bacterium]
MKIRIAIGLGGHTLDADEFASLVTDLASLGFDSLWVSEVLTGPGPDPLIALATAAQLNPKLKLGTTMLIPGRNEIRLAKSLATLDVLSRGRLLLTFVPGLAHGQERDAIGVPVPERAGAIERTLPRLRRWWAGDEVDGVRVLPRPVQDPLEVWLGGLAPASLTRCGRIADGWLGAACTPQEANLARTAINDAARKADREVDPEHFGISIAYTHRPLDDGQLAALAARTRGRDTDPRALVPVGYDALRAVLQAYISAGLSKFVLRPPSLTTSWTDELTALSQAVTPLQT